MNESANEEDIEIQIEAIFSKRLNDMIGECQFPQQKILQADDLKTAIPEEISQTNFDSTKEPNSQGLFSSIVQNREGNSLTHFKLHQFWTGNNAFCWKGKFLNGLKKPSFQSRTTLFLIISSFTLYLLFPGSFLYDKISPVMAMATFYLFILTVFFYCMTFA